MNTIDKLNLRLAPLLASCDDATIHENEPLVASGWEAITWNEQIVNIPTEWATEWELVGNKSSDLFCAVGTKFPTIAVNYPWEG